VLAAISVDLDSLPHYCRIQGLPETMLDDRARGLVATHAVPRFLELFEAVRIQATFFVIGSELSDPQLCSALRAAHAAGIELASHSDSHDYSLSRQGFDACLADLTRAEEQMVVQLGVRPVGFRAPGYTLSPALLQAAIVRGYSYDSSAFPAAPYYLAKASVMGALALLGRPSRAILDTPAVLLAPRVPYRPDGLAPYSRGKAPLLELPVTVTPRTRLPCIGTFAVAAPLPLVKAAFDACARDALFNFELHALDVLDASDGIPAALVAQQRDAAIPAARKLARLETLFARLGEGRERVTLAQAAKRLAPGLL
jgi:peptidoglycan-N-acetylglucosamine deacetylase